MAQQYTEGTEITGVVYATMSLQNSLGCKALTFVTFKAVDGCHVWSFHGRIARVAYIRMGFSYVCICSHFFVRMYGLVSARFLKKGPLAH